MKQRMRIVVGACLLLSSYAASATYIANVTIAEVSLNRQLGNFLFIRLSQAPTGAPACATNGYWHYTIPLAETMGKNIYPMVLAALAAKQLVTIGGVDACQEYSNVESLAAFSPQS